MPAANTTESGPSPTELYRPSQVAGMLGVSAATLRRWSRRFEDYLHLGNAGQDERSHRRYTGEDVAILRQVKAYLNQGWTYEQVAERLAEGPVSPAEAGFDSVETEPDELDEESTPSVSEAPSANGEGPAITSDDDGGPLLPSEPMVPAAQFLRDAVSSIHDTQQIILNSQLASRDMLGVMIQDNLNLKDENTSVRERMLSLERDLAEVRRHHADYRERMETRVRVLEDAVANLMARQAPTAVQSPQTPPSQSSPYEQSTGYGQQSPYQQPGEKRSFWSRLIGG
ncbi:MAG: MerR family transcriptional regulator [Chloroflexota bacterium]|nr:MerR family transcriptional regulator [Chloroflexota bacterium]